MTRREIEQRYSQVKAEAPRFRELGYSVDSIAARLDVTPATVYRALKGSRVPGNTIPATTPGDQAK